jgi:hypothetical protein
MTGRGITPTCPPAQQSRLPTGYLRRTVGNRAAGTRSMSPLSRAAWRWRRLLRRKMPPGAGASSGHRRCNRANSADCGRDIAPTANRYRDSSAPGAAPHRARTFQQCVAKVFDVKPETAHSIRATCFEHPVPPSSTPRSPDSPEESVGKVCCWAARASSASTAPCHGDDRVGRCPRRCKRRYKSVRVVGSRGFGPKSWRLQRVRICPLKPSSRLLRYAAGHGA